MQRTGSTVVITYNETDITSHVMFEATSFEVQFSAVPGTFELTLKDPEQVLGPFITGKEVMLTIDGTLMFAGYLTQVSRKFAFPADRTDAAHGGASVVKTRLWVLRGVDYNILFDKRILRFSTALSGPGFLTQLPSFYQDDQAGAIIRNELPKYIDAPAGFDLTTDVEDVGPVVPWETPHKAAAWNQQGTSWRKVMEDFSQFNGAVWYLQPNRRLFFKSIESMQSRWGFSDVPNKHSVVGSSPGFQGATYGFRELDATEDGSYIVNDALVWGGSEWAGDSGGTLFARARNQDSIDIHGRWQTGEAHFGEDGYGVQSGVSARADTIVNGGPNQQEDQLYGFKFPQWQFRLAWFGHDVPEINGIRDHLTPGQVVTIWLYTFGTKVQDTIKPLIQLLPLRQLKVSFPDLDPTGKGYVRFDGFFGIQTNDPWTLWRYLLRAKSRTITTQIATVTNGSTRAVFGAFGSFYPTENPDGVRTEFSISIGAGGDVTPIGYIENTTSVWRNGILQRVQIDYQESDPENGKFTFITAPLATDWLWIQCRTMAG